MNSSHRKDSWHFSALCAAGSKGAVLMGMVAAMVIALPSTARAATALMVGGMNQSTLDDVTMSLALNRKFTGVDPESGTSWQRVSVNWPAQLAPYFGNVTLKDSVSKGTANLVEAIKTAYGSSSSGPITVLGTSAGTLVVNEAMRELANDPTAPPSSAINFVVLADSTQKLAGSTGYWNPFATLSGFTYGAPPQTPYDLTVVMYEYDGWADFPDRWWNPVAVSNAVIGGFLLHAATWFVDLSTVPASDITVTTNPRTGSVTTSYLIRPKTLPLVQMFPQLASMEASLRQQADAGYSRNDKTAASSAVAAAIAAPNAQSHASAVEAPSDVDADLAAEQASAQQEPAHPSPVTVNENGGTADSTDGVAPQTTEADVKNLDDGALPLDNDAQNLGVDALPMDDDALAIEDDALAIEDDARAEDDAQTLDDDAANPVGNKPRTLSSAGEDDAEDTGGTASTGVTGDTGSAGEAGAGSEGDGGSDD